MKSFPKFFRRALPLTWILVVLIIPIMKIVGTVDWSWWAVTSSVWLPVLLVYSVPALAIAIVVFLVIYKLVIQKW